MADAELDKILGEIRKGIVQAMHEVERSSRDIFAEHAEEDVYKPYDDVRETYQYERRGKGPGGIQNPDTYEVKVDDKDLSMSITSNLKGNPMYADCYDGWDSGYITDIIESGVGYHWKTLGPLPGSSIYTTYEAAGHPLARPWMEKSGDDFVDNLLIPMIDLKMSQLLGG